MPNLSTINKYVFLRGYLEGEPKMLVDGSAVTANTYEETKKILLARYGDTNCIIQSHLDFLESLPPACMHVHANDQVLPLLKIKLSGMAMLI